MKIRERQQRSYLKKIATFLPVLIPVVLFVAVLVLAGTINDQKAQLAEEKLAQVATERPPANVVVLDLAPVTMKDQVNLPGVVEPWKKLSVLTRVEGTVVTTRVADGESVVEGQLIAQLETADYRIAHDSARADHELAAAHHKRMKKLYAKQIIPAAEMEEAEARMKTSKARLEKAKLQLSRCDIKAPISGVIQNLEAKEGLYLNSFDPVAEIIQIDRVKAVVGIPESDVALVRTIEEVPLTIQALDNMAVIGRFHFLASEPDSDARLYKLELEVENTNNSILPGMFFRAQVIKKVIEDAVSVPLFSVIKRNNEQFVYLEENGVARRSPVELGVLNDWMVEVKKGVSPGSRIVVEGHRNIDQGHKLKVVRVVSRPEEVML